MNIRQLIREAIGQHRFETGTVTSEANQLILFAQNDKETHDFAMEHSTDLKAIFLFCWDKYKRKHGALRGNNGDQETIMYDFMANFEPPEPSKKDVALEIFGGYMNGKVKFDQNWSRGFIVNVVESFVEDAKAMAAQKGYEAKAMGGFDYNSKSQSLLVMPKEGVMQENDGYATTTWADNKDGKEIKMTIKDVEAYLDTKGVPVTQLKTSELAPLSIHGNKKDQATLDRVQRADLAFPMIVSRASNGRINMVLDGQHRLQKAVNNGVPSVKARVLDLRGAPQEMQWLFR